MFELNKIYNEDCFKTIDRMVENNVKVDTILTSPPYNMTKRKGGYADTGRYDVYEDWKTEEDYLNWTINLFNKFETILNRQRAIIYNFSYSIENPSLPYKLVSAIVNNTEFDLIDTIIWKKRCGLPFPANGKRLCRNWEYVFVFVRKDEVNTYENNRRIKSVSEKTGQQYYEAVYNFVEAPNNDGKCPYNQATYSSELCDKLFDIYAKDGWIVYDPFMGSGTTAVSCKRRRLKYIGSEISEKQVEYSNKRLNGYNMEQEIVYFEINNWFYGRDYPNDEIFRKWINDNQFRDDEWCKENKLCVMCGAIDMSMNYCVAAPKSWVEKNCPKLLTDEEYEYKIVTCGWDKETNEPTETVDIHTKKYSDFLCQPDEYGDVYGHIADDWCFPEYKEENFGVTWNDSWWGDSDDDEEDDE